MFGRITQRGLILRSRPRAFVCGPSQRFNDQHDRLLNRVYFSGIFLPILYALPSVAVQGFCFYSMPIADAHAIYFFCVVVVDAPLAMGEGKGGMG